MLEGIQTQDMEAFRRKEYEDFRKEILAFKDLPESTFSDQHASGSGDKLGIEEAKNLYAHGLMSRIENSGLPQQQSFELVHLWEKEILGASGTRQMQDESGNII